MSELVPESQFLDAKDALLDLSLVDSATYQTNTRGMYGEGRRLTLWIRGTMRVPPSVMAVLRDYDLGIADIGRDDSNGSLVVFCV